MLRTLLLSFITVATSLAIPPEHRLTKNGFVLENVSTNNLVIYDNDWWTDVPDAAYIWAKASLGECKLAGNIITRCTFGWEKKYAHQLSEQTREAELLLKIARDSGLKNIPTPVVGSTIALRKPASGKITDTEFEKTAGSELIIATAKKASPEKPLLLFVGGSCTTVASAFLTDPSITNRAIVFQIDGKGYNGSDGWAWDIVMQNFRFANWARGYFWDKVSTWNPEPFRNLPKNPLGDFLREYSTKELGRANQWGDAPWIFWLYDPACLTKLEPWDQHAITIPRDGNNPKAMETEFFRTMMNPAVYSGE